jgi:outer membrane receptor protein involved in Fe transport
MSKRPDNYIELALHAFEQVPLIVAGLLAGATAMAAEPIHKLDSTLPTVVVVGVTPLPGGDIKRDTVAAPVQVATSDDIDRSHAVDLTAFMNRALGSVYVNELQNNPLQPDISYRGYTASPLLGTPQGLSVYLDGVRLNQPFGDVVSWDLIPRAAIRSLTLMPGSNPLFGLNSLGGALSLRSKDGFTDPGYSVQAGYGSNRRRSVELEAGGSTGNWFWYATGNQFRDDGWREYSPSDARQLFAKLGWRADATQLALTVAAADTDLTGNGLQEQQLLAADYASVYTQPDNTQNRSLLLNLQLTHQLSAALGLSANAYYRRIRSTTLNGDINAGSLGESLYQPNAAERAALTAAGYTGFPLGGEAQSNTPFPRWRCIANALLNDEPNEKCDGLLNRTRTAQHNQGFSGQLTLQYALHGYASRLVAGAAFDASSAHFTQSSQFGYLTADRGVIGVTGAGAFADGTQDAENATDSRVDLGGNGRTYSLYIGDMLALNDRLHLSVAGRYDRNSIRNRDALNPGGGTGSLDGDHTFGRFNPSVGLSLTASPMLSYYASYSQSSRAPSSIELGCADPASPCRLPNSMAGDPPLDEVVTSTWEAGVRGAVADRLRWNVGVFSADNRDDILFVAGDQAGFGYFRNFSRTRRQGLELGATSHVGKLTAGISYTLLDATFRSAELLAASGNSSNDAPAPGFDGNIDIAPGDRIPLTPRQIVKAYMQCDVAPRVSIDTDAVYIGGSYARGNENNRHRPDGVYYLGEGSTGGYTVVNLGADFRPSANLKLFVQLNNLLDRQYQTASLLGATAFNAAGSFVARPFAAPVIGGERPLQQSTFYAPGAPRSWWIGVRYSLVSRR